MRLLRARSSFTFKQTIECGFNLKLVRDMIITYGQFGIWSHLNVKQEVAGDLGICVLTSTSKSAHAKFSSDQKSCESGDVTFLICHRTKVRSRDFKSCSLSCQITIMPSLVAIDLLQMKI